MPTYGRGVTYVHRDARRRHARRFVRDNDRARSPARVDNREVDSRRDRTIVAPAIGRSGGRASITCPPSFPSLPVAKDAPGPVRVKCPSIF